MPEVVIPPLQIGKETLNEYIERVDRYIPCQYPFISIEDKGDILYHVSAATISLHPELKGETK